MADFRLRVANGAAAGREIALDGEIVIGRECGGPGELAEDPLISRRPAPIPTGGGGDLTVEDLGSRNGTFLNGQRVTTRRPLDVRDRLTVGETAIDVVPV